MESQVSTYESVRYQQRTKCLRAYAECFHSVDWKLFPHSFGGKKIPTQTMWALGLSLSNFHFRSSQKFRITIILHFLPSKAILYSTFKGSFHIQSLTHDLIIRGTNHTSQLQDSLSGYIYSPYRWLNQRLEKIFPFISQIKFKGNCRRVRSFPENRPTVFWKGKPGFS